MAKTSDLTEQLLGGGVKPSKSRSKRRSKSRDKRRSKQSEEEKLASQFAKSKALAKEHTADANRIGDQLRELLVAKLARRSKRAQEWVSNVVVGRIRCAGQVRHSKFEFYKKDEDGESNFDKLAQLAFEHDDLDLSPAEARTAIAGCVTVSQSVMFAPGALLEPACQKEIRRLAKKGWLDIRAQAEIKKEFSAEATFKPYAKALWSCFEALALGKRVNASLTVVEK